MIVVAVPGRNREWEGSSIRGGNNLILYDIEIDQLIDLIFIYFLWELFFCWGKKLAVLDGLFFLLSFGWEKKYSFRRDFQ
jgi:hypothetical protein